MTVESVRKLILQVFDLPMSFEFPPGLRPAYVPGWDSHGWMRLILTLEEKFDQEIPLDIFDHVVTVEQFCNAVVQYSVERERELP